MIFFSLILHSKAKRSISVLKEKAKEAASQAKDIASSNKAGKNMNGSNKGPTDSNEQGKKVRKVLMVTTE